MSDRLETLEEWLEGWEAAVLSGQSRISREEAIRRWEKHVRQWEEKYGN